MQGHSSFGEQGKGKGKGKDKLLPKRIMADIATI